VIDTRLLRDATVLSSPFGFGDPICQHVADVDGVARETLRLGLHMLDHPWPSKSCRPTDIEALLQIVSGMSSIRIEFIHFEIATRRLHKRTAEAGHASSVALISSVRTCRNVLANGFDKRGD